MAAVRSQREENNKAINFIQTISRRSARLIEEDDFYNRLYRAVNDVNGMYRPNDVIGNQTAIDYYNQYIQLRQLQQERSRRGRIIFPEDDIIPYPFKSKVKGYLKKNPDTKVEVIPSIAPVKKRYYDRPTFSKYRGTWEIDYVFNLLSPRDEDVVHLFCINVNTKYLVVYPVSDKSVRGLLISLNALIADHQVHSFKGDGEKGFIKMSPVLNEMGISTDFAPATFTNHTRVVDSVIKTIRNAIGYRIISEDQLQQIVDYYNNTYHTSIDCTPIEMMMNHEYEDQFIRYCTNKLLKIKQRQEFEGLLSYVNGNILLVHCDLRKTADRDEKRRRFWDRVGSFIKYDHGNAVVRLIGRPVNMGSRDADVIVVPVQYTKLIAKNINSIPEYYHSIYNFNE
jgi:hypothetical protein